MKFVHIADIHLGMAFTHAGFGAKKGAQRRREIKETLLRIISYCEDEVIDLLLIAGDLFEDATVTISELKDINRGFSGLSKTHVVIGAGNHDPISNNQSPYRLIEWCDQVTVFETELTSVYFEDIQAEVWGFSWHQKTLPPFEYSGEWRLDQGRHQILMLHGDVYQRNDYHYINPAAVENYGFDYVALGHIHKLDFIKPWMAYPGSPEPLDFSETGTHGFIKGSIDGDGLKTEPVAFAKRSFRKLEVDVSSFGTFEAIFEAVKEVMSAIPEEDFVRMTLTGVLNTEVILDLDALTEGLTPGQYYVALKDETEADLDLDQLAEAYKDSMIGLYINRLRAMDMTDPVVIDALKQGVRLMLDGQVRG